MSDNETSVPWTVADLEAAGLRGSRGAIKRLYPELYAHILHKAFDGNASATEDYLNLGDGTVHHWFTLNGLAALGRDRPRRGRNLEDRDRELSGEEVWALWGDQPLTEYALTYEWTAPRKQEFVSLVLISDLHAQSRLFDKPRLQSTIDYIGADPALRWACVGDLFTNESTQSVGQLEDQTIGIAEAVGGLTYGFRPIAKQCVGIAHGNHDARIKHKFGVGYNPVRELCRNLEANYLHYAKHVILQIGNIEYCLYIHHGKGGAASDGGRLNMVVGVSRTVTSDITIVGHLHDEMNKKLVRRGPAKENDRSGNRPVVDHKQHAVMVASFERYGGYAQEHALPPTPLGSCRIEFSTKRKDWRVIQ